MVLLAHISIPAQRLKHQHVNARRFLLNMLLWNDQRKRRGRSATALFGIVNRQKKKKKIEKYTLR